MEVRNQVRKKKIKREVGGEEENGQGQKGPRKQGKTRVRKRGFFPLEMGDERGPEPNIDERGLTVGEGEKGE